MEKIVIGISSCLLGEIVRYDGGHASDRFITDTLGQYFAWVPVCPEVEYGLPTPREAMRLEGDPASPRLITKKTRLDHTHGMAKWIAVRVRELDDLNLCGFILKSRSPSCGPGRVNVYTEDGMVSGKGAGLFSRAFAGRFPLIPVIDNDRLQSPAMRENFVERIFAFSRWRLLTAGRKTLGNLVDFHTAHKLLIMSHSRRHLSILGKLVAEGKRYSLDRLYAEYIGVLTDGLQHIATVRKNTDVLVHAAGYFKRLLDSDDKTELFETIEDYRMGRIPLIVPVTLINHYAHKFDVHYLKHQSYLKPHPSQLMMSNHA
ncbi:MAG TPA: DUF523 and DUF1722 domain-containing protein [Thermodesulfovibrionales bacterium]|nr:DUF523 and DUF1722 domain-containing protein [Thermodesulfovibrionales bacterium]